MARDIFTATLDMARRGELVISGSIDGAGFARLTAAELDLVVAASPALDVLHLRDGRRVARVHVGFAADAETAGPRSPASPLDLPDG